MAAPIPPPTPVTSATLAIDVDTARLLRLGPTLTIGVYARNMSAYTPIVNPPENEMPGDVAMRPTPCNCLALRQAARRVTQFYDQHLAHVGLRTTQFSILAKLNRLGPLPINAPTSRRANRRKRKAGSA
jgi:hypothetical protein